MKFHRSIGEYSGKPFSIRGELLSPEAYERHLDEVLPNAMDKAQLVRILKQPDSVVRENR